MVWCRCFIGRNSNRNIFCTAGFSKRHLGNHYRTYHWLYHVVPRRSNRRKVRRSAMETVKMSFGEKGGFSFLIPECTSAGWLDCYYDLRRSYGRKRYVKYRQLGMVSGNRCTDRTMDFYRHHKLGKVNTVAMAALFILTMVLCKVIFYDGGTCTCNWRGSHVLWCSG